MVGLSNGWSKWTDLSGPHRTVSNQGRAKAMLNAQNEQT